MARNEKMRQAVEKMLTEGKLILVTGDRGAGKTHLTMVLADWFLYNGGWVLSNILVSRKSAGEKWEDKEAYPEHYKKITTLAQFFLYLSNILHEDPNAKVLFLIDEAAVSLESLSFQAFLSREMVKVATLIRKFNAAMVLISIRPELVIKKLRTEEGLLDVRLAKEPFLMKRYAADLLRDGYEIKVLTLVEWPERGINFLPIIVPMTKRLALPREYCEVGGLYFDTKGAASFDPGVHPVTRKPFKFGELIAVLGAQPSQLYPRLLHEFMHTDPTQMIADAIAARGGEFGEDIEAEDLVEGEGGGEAPVTETGRKRLVVELLQGGGNMSLAEIGRQTGITKQRVHQIKIECETKGYDVVLAEIEQRERLLA